MFGDERNLDMFASLYASAMQHLRPTEPGWAAKVGNSLLFYLIIASSPVSVLDQNPKYVNGDPLSGMSYIILNLQMSCMHG